jgi:hypothetical protein
MLTYLRSKKKAFKILKILVNADKGGFSQMETLQPKQRRTNKVDAGSCQCLTLFSRQLLSRK